MADSTCSICELTVREASKEIKQTTLGGNLRWSEVAEIWGGFRSAADPVRDEVGLHNLWQNIPWQFWSICQIMHLVEICLFVLPLDIFHIFSCYYISMNGYPQS